MSKKVRDEMAERYKHFGAQVIFKAGWNAAVEHYERIDNILEDEIKQEQEKVIKLDQKLSRDFEKIQNLKAALKVAEDALDYCAKGLNRYGVPHGEASRAKEALAEIESLKNGTNK